MRLKEQVLSAIEHKKGDFISGEELASLAGVSRAAVWKAIQTLRKEGHLIEAVPNKGYSLQKGSNILSSFAIEKNIHPDAGPFTFEAHASVTSTNELAKDAAGTESPEGLVILAEEQTAGKGRMNRTFFSPANSGVYFSLLLRPKIKAEDALLITTAAATATARAIEAITGVPTEIKWVNDIYCHGKKVSGILTEASLNLENGELEYVVLGIGINVHEPESGFPAELTEIASSVLQTDDRRGHPDVRSRIVAETLNRFWEIYRKLPDKSFLKEYKARSFIPGKRILIHSGNTTTEGLALEIDDDCQLVVQLDDGTIQSLSSGEVSVQMKEGDKF